MRSNNILLTVDFHPIANYPWFPAVVFEEDQEDVPQTVLQTRQFSTAQPGEGYVHLVRFFDDSESWYALYTLSQIKLLTVGHEFLSGISYPGVNCSFLAKTEVIEFAHLNLSLHN